MLETDLISERFYLKQDGEFGIFYNTDIPRYTTDQGGHIDGAFAGDHLLPVSEHGSDWRTTDMLCHGVHVLQLGQAAEEKVYMRVHDHGVPLG